MALKVVYQDPGTRGYWPVQHMARLASELLEAELVVVDRGTSRLSRLGATIASRSREGHDDCLLLCPAPPALEALVRLEDWRSSYRRVVAWVFDSFWWNYTPSFMRVQRHFDHLFVTEPEDLELWRDRFHTEASWLPWGADALRFGSADGAREVDLMRLGRQPPEWDDDASTDANCREHGLRFVGRPPESDDPSENEHNVAEACRRAKLTLSFSNRVSPSAHTHPEREYLTGRWTTAISSGAIVAGVPPCTEAVDRLLWPEALLPLVSTDREEGLAVVADAARAWRPDLAAHNQRMALARLDWRWRFKEIAEVLGALPARLASELAELEARIALCDAALAGAS